MTTQGVDIMPMSPAQQRLWFLDQLDPGTTMFNIPAAYRFHGPLDPERVRRVLSRIVERHEVLRTTLTSIDGEAVQVIHPPAPVELPVSDLSALEPEARDAALRRELRAAAARPFDLATGPLFRPALWRVAPDDHVLMLCMHHAVSDGWSLGVLSEEFAAFWEAGPDAEPAGLAPLPIQYADYAHWHRSRMESGELDGQRAYWLDQLRGQRGILRLPTDRPRPATQTFSAGAYEFRLSERVVDHLRAFGKEAGVTLFMSCITAYAVLLWRYSGQTDLVVGIPVAGRMRAELEPLVGFFVNGVVIRFKIDPAASLRDLVSASKRTLLEAFENQEFSLDALLQSIEIERLPGFEPLVQATFALQNFPRSTRTLPGLDVEPLVAECMHTRYDLMLLLSETQEGLSGNMVYNADLFERTTIARMMAQLERILESMAATPDAPLASLTLADAAELFEVLGLEPQLYERVLPLVPMQRDLYVDSLSNPESRQNCVGLTFPVPDPVDPAVWAAAAQALVDAQPAMRVRMRASSAPYTEPVYQAILRADRAEFEVIDLSGETLSDRELDARLEAIVRRPYDPHGALARHFLVKLPAGTWLAGFAHHHMLLDGIGTVQAAAWIAAEYTRRMGGTLLPAPLPPAAFHDAIPALRAATDTREALEHWRRLLAEVLPLACPADAPPGGGRLAIKHAVIPPDLWVAVREFCRARRITPQILMKCVFAMVADAYCRAEGDLLVQEFHAGRGPGHGAALGCYYQGVPFVIPRRYLGREASGSALLEYARSWQQQAPQSERISIFEQRRLAPPGRVSLLFNFITAKLTIPVGSEVAEAQRFTPYADGFVQFEISTVGDEIRMGLTYDRSIFAEEGFIERVLAVTKQLLAGTDRLADLTLLLPGETRSAGPETSPAFVSIPERIAAVVRQRPEAPAVIQGERVLTYRELGAEAERIARALAAEGIGPGDLIGICMERSPLMIVAILAVLQTGAAYVPLDAAYPEARLRHMARDAECRAILTQAGLVQRLSALGPRLLALDDPDATPLRGEAAPLPARRPKSTFYVLYTSGSTGMPKGAAVTDLGEWNLVDWYTREFGIGSADRIVIVSAFGFDLTQKNFFAALISGAALVLPESAEFEPRRILEAFERTGATIVNCAPSAFYSLLDDPARFSALATLRYVFLGGEPIRVNRLEAWTRSPHFHAAIVNHYGPTECTDVVSFFRIDEPGAFRDRDVPLGDAVDNVRLHILDELGRPLPPYAVGELCISGVCVGGGYWRNPELTARTFVPNPFGAGLMYRTGDLAYRLPSGVPVFFGRRDFQVKIRGLRIELGEVEAALREATGLDDWLVLAADDALLACVKSEAPAPSTAELRRLLAGRLPEYMLPQRVVAVTAWPLGPNGKVDRAALARAAPAEGPLPLSPPQTETEWRLAELFKDVIDRAEIGRDESFFALGGHSLLAARVAGRISVEFGIELPLRTFFEAPTIAALGEHVDALVCAALEGLSVEEVDRLLSDVGG